MRTCWLWAVLVGCAPAPLAPTSPSYEYHFDRNALVDSVLAGRSLIALTASGNLLRFDADTLRLEGERHPPSRAVCLGEGPLVGFEDGGVGRLDARTLDVEIVSRGEGRPLWIRGEHVLSRIEGAACELRGKGRFTIDGPPGRAPQVFHLDAGGRLWMGVDGGEWGGWVGFLNLGSGQVTQVERGKGVYGFVATPDGRVLAYGGIAHMGYTRGFVKALRPDGSKTLFETEKNQPGPTMPITHVLPEAGGFRVFAYDSIFTADPSFKTWSLIGRVEARVAPGRPDAMGSYPALRRLHPTGQGWIASTAKDGIWRNGLVSVPGQLEVSWPNRTLGDWVLEGDWTETAWSRTGAAWRELPDEVPLKPADGRHWHERRYFRRPDGETLAVVSDNSTPGRGVVLRWKDGAWKVDAVSDPLPLDPRQVFMTPDGVLRAATDDALFRFDAGKWVKTGRPVNRPGWVLDAIDFPGPPWIVKDVREHQLFKSTDTTFTPLELGLKAFDAIPFGDGTLMAATSDGLRRVEVANGRSTPGPAAPGRVSRLARDAKGRLWAGGDGLWVLEEVGWRKIDGHAVLKAPRVNMLAADAEGIVVGLSGRGLMFIRY